MCRCKSFSISIIVLVAIIGIGYQLFIRNDDAIYKFVIQRAFNSFESGTLCLQYKNHNNRIEKYGKKSSSSSKCTNTIVIDDELGFFRTLAVSGANTGLGEAYFLNYWSVNNNNNLNELPQTIYFLMYNQIHRVNRLGVIMEYMFSVKHLYNWLLRTELFGGDVHRQEDDIHAISHHYDIGNDFYTQILGDELSGYSCGIFMNETDSVYKAQDNKWDLVIKKARINSPNLKTIDIGCGWGYFPSYINNKTDSFVVGVTISQQQYNFMNILYSQQVTSNKIAYNFLDYRDLHSKYGSSYFDRAVSIGMFEHVGYNNYDIYFQSIYDVLKPDSYFLLHYISRTDIHSKFKIADRNTACQGSNFISTYIFPNGCLVPSDWVWESAQEAGFRLIHEEHFGKHYAKTLNKWRLNMIKNQENILTNPKYDEKFYKTYEFYFAFCESVFINGRAELVQQLFYKPPNNKQEEFNTKWDHNIVYNPNNNLIL